MPPNGIALLGPNGQPTNAHMVAAALSTPLNDQQVLCLMAAHIDGATGGGLLPETVAERCFALMAHIVEGHKNGKLHQAHLDARALYGDPRDHPEAAASNIVPGGSGQ